MLLHVCELRWQFWLTPLNLLLSTSPCAGFLGPAKVVGQGWVEILAPHQGAGMCLDFLDLS